MALSGTAIVAEVEKFTHSPYVYGAAGPTTFDCSGLVQYVLGQLGVKDVPRTSEAQWSWVQRIPKSQLAPGDLVFAQFPGDNASPGHVGVYTGNGQVLSAEDPALGVGYSSLDSWGSHVVGFGRVPNSSAAPAPGGGTSGLWPSQVTGLFTNLDSAAGDVWGTAAGLFSPTPWIRAGAGLLAGLLMAGGLWFLIKAAA
jgi:hypothetical protein